MICNKADNVAVGSSTRIYRVSDEREMQTFRHSTCEPGLGNLLLFVNQTEQLRLFKQDYQTLFNSLFEI